MNNNRDVLLTDLRVQVLLAAYFLSNLAVSMPNPILAAHLASLNSPSSYSGVVFACFPAAMMLTSPFAVALSTRLGRVPVLGAGLFGLSLSTLLVPMTSTLRGLVLGRTLQGCAGSAVETGVLDLVSVWFPAQQARLSGLIESIGGLGYMIGPIFGALLVSWRGFTTPFVVCGMLTLAAAFALLIAHSRLHPERNKKSVSTTTYGACGESKIHNISLRQGMLQPLPDQNSKLIIQPNATANLGPIFGLETDLEEDRFAAVGKTTCKSTIVDVTKNSGISTEMTPGWGLFCNLRLAIPALTGICCYFSVSLVHPTAATYLQAAYGLSLEQVGYTLALPDLSYLLVAWAVGELAESLGSKACMRLGCAVQILAYLLLGPAPAVLGLAVFAQEKARLLGTLAGFVLLGVGFALAFVPVL
jgi:MFS family permease